MISSWSFAQTYVGQSQLTVQTSSPLPTGHDPDIRLMIKHGSTPTNKSHDCRSDNGSANQSCTIENPQAGLWYVKTIDMSGQLNGRGSVSATITT